MTDPTLPLAGLSPVDGKAVAAKFDGGLLSSDGGVLALREAEQRLGRRRTISRTAPNRWLGALAAAGST